MNFLAHAYLSNSDQELITGNFIADRVKGKAWENFPGKIKIGILHHRFIDTFTDSHESNLNSIHLLQPYFGKYSGVVMDVMNDHLLSLSWDKYHTISLKKYISHTYDSLLKHEEILPEKSKQMLPYMISQDWLGSYISLEEISEILKRMSKRTPFESGMENSYQPLKNNFDELQENFSHFFPDLKQAANEQLQKLLNDEQNNH